MSDELMKLMGWLDVGPQFQGLDAIVNPGLAPKVQAAVDDILPNRLWRPDDPLHKPITRAAATAPGSTRRNDFTFFFEKWEHTITRASHWSSWDDEDRGGYSCTFATSNYSRELIDRLFGTPGRTITAASELEDEPAQPGFQATGPRDDFAGHMAYHGYKPGTPEWDEAARAWVRREEWKRVQSGELDRASRLAVRDAHLERYKQTDADRLIEEMMT